MRIKKHDELQPKRVSTVFFHKPNFSDTCKHTKNKSWRRCRLYFRGRMQCWWIFDYETDYTYLEMLEIMEKIIANLITIVQNY
jgi:hypothetical protein